MSDKPPITIFDMQTLPLLFQIIKAMIPFLDFPMAKNVICDYPIK